MRCLCSLAASNSIRKASALRTSIFNMCLALVVLCQIAAGEELIAVIDKHFQPQFVENLVKLLITKYFTLKASDLQHWQEDPEEFIEVRAVGCAFSVVVA